MQPFVHAVGADVVGPLNAAVVHAQRLQPVGVEAVHAAQDIHAVLQYIICRGVTACSLTVEALLADVLAGEGDEVVVVGNGRFGHGGRHQRRLDVGGDAAVQLPGGGNELADPAHALEGGDVHVLNMLDALHRHVILVHNAAIGDVGGDDQLAADVRAVEIVGGIGLGVAQALGLLQGGGEAAAGAVHGVEDKIGGAVHNAADADDRLLVGAALQTGQPGDAAAGCRRAPQRDAPLFGQGHQLAVVPGDEELVGGDDVFARREGAFDPFIGRMQSADDLHHRVDALVGEDLVDAFGNGAGHAVGNHQAQGAGHLHVGAVLQELVDAVAHSAQAKQRNAHWFVIFHQKAPSFKGKCPSEKNTCIFLKNSISYRKEKRKQIFSNGDIGYGLSEYEK